MIINYEISSQDVEELYNNRLEEFINSTKEELDIANLFYEVSFRNILDEDGYMCQDKLFCLILTPDYQNVRELVLSSERIAATINRRFYKIYDEEVFNWLAEIFVKYLIAYNLNFIKSVEDSLITREVMNLEKKHIKITPLYKTFARHFARNQVLDREGLGEEIQNIIIGSQLLSNPQANNIIQSYNSGQ